VQNERLVALLQEIAAGNGATAAQVAIAWVLSRAPEVVTIPGMKTRAHLAENLAGGELLLAPEQLQRIEDLLASSPVAGERHPPAMMKILDRD
jgi:aryl-alcohol dehydrogenase-like predicted oxidoreductase